MQYLHREFLQPHPSEIVRTAVERNYLRSSKTQHPGLPIHHAHERKIVLVHQDRRACYPLERGRRPHVVNMRMGDDNLFQCKSKGREPGQDKVDVVTGIDDYCFAGFLISND